MVFMFEYLTVTSDNFALATQPRDYQINRGSEKARGQSPTKEMQTLYKQKMEEEYKRLGCLCMAELLNLLGKDDWDTGVSLEDSNTLVLKRPVNI